MKLHARLHFFGAADVVVRRAAVAVITVALGSCADGDSTEIVPDSVLSATAPMHAPVLTIEVNTPDQLSGTFSNNERGLGFAISQTDLSHQFTLWGSDGSLLMRATQGPELEQLEFGQFTVRGPSGDLFSANRDLSRTSSSGDPESGIAAMTSADLGLTPTLLATLAARTDIAPDLVAPFGVVPQRASEGQRMFGESQEALAVTACGSTWITLTCDIGAQAVDPICGPAFWWSSAGYNACMKSLLPFWCAGCFFVHI